MWKQKNGKNQYRIDPMYEYGKIEEEELNKHNRTKDPNNKIYTPFTFTDDDNKGVVSFTECFERWVEKAEEDESIDLMEVFGISWDELKIHY